MSITSGSAEKDDASVPRLWSLISPPTVLADIRTILLLQTDLIIPTVTLSRDYTYRMNMYMVKN